MLCMNTTDLFPGNNLVTPKPRPFLHHLRMQQIPCLERSVHIVGVGIAFMYNLYYPRRFLSDQESHLGFLYIEGLVWDAPYVSLIYITASRNSPPEGKYVHTPLWNGFPCNIIHHIISDRSQGTDYAQNPSMSFCCFLCEEIPWRG